AEPSATGRQVDEIYLQDLVETDTAVLRSPHPHGVRSAASGSASSSLEKRESSMLWSSTPPLLRRPPRWAVLAAASTTAAAVGVSVVLVGGIAQAGSSGPVVTRAALDPSLVAGRGASVGFAEQEAENATTNGTVIGFGTGAYTLPAEASGRKAVSL